MRFFGGGSTKQTPNQQRQTPQHCIHTHQRNLFAHQSWCCIVSNQSQKQPTTPKQSTNIDNQIVTGFLCDPLCAATGMISSFRMGYMQSSQIDFQCTRFMFSKWYTKFYNVLLVVIEVARITMMKKYGPNKNNRKYGLVFAKHNMIG